MELKTETSGWIRNSITFKLIAIGLLVLILLIPTSMIQNLITERSKSHTEVKKEITDKWGANQIIGGPVLTLPYKKISGIAGNQSEEIAYAHFLPEKLKIQGNIKPEVRSRGIYKVILYNSDLVLSGLFLKPDINFLNVPEENILWDEAFVTIGIPDLRGIKRLINIEWNDESYIGKPGVINRDIFESGIHSKIPINPDSGAYNFSLKLDINGSENIGFLPFGKETQVNIESPWKSPSFSGAFLPEKREITNDGFKAEWNILSLNRNYPQSCTGGEKKLFWNLHLDWNYFYLLIIIKNLPDQLNML
ncbi:MAG: cell envelope integrity protein CreD [Bacteroidales bacterium]|nr:cell envelope integrity protein CreD [Bacteroidales bacterium]